MKYAADFRRITREPLRGKWLCIPISICLVIPLFLAGCGETKQRIPFKEAESMMTVAYANEILPG